MQIAIVLGLLVLAVVLFALESLSVDIITLILLVALVVTQVLTPEEAFAGFSNDIIIILASIFVLSGALQVTGVMDVAGVWLYRIAGRSTNRLLAALMVSVGGISAFMNNTTATAVFISPTIGLADRAKLSPSKLLMPLAYASILGGTCTLIGTSTNIAVSGYMTRAGLEPLDLFELTPVGLILMGVGILYMIFVGQRILPDHPDESLTANYAIREYLSEIVVVPDSHMIGQKIFESDLAKLGFRILAIVRGGRKFLPGASTIVEAGDILLIKGKVPDLMKVKETAGIEINPELKLGDLDLQSEDIKIAEALITPQSNLLGRTLRGVSFRQRYEVTALAIYRQGQALREEIDRIRLRLGDLLLIQGTTDRIEFLRRNSDLWILEDLSPLLPRRRKALYTGLIFAGAVIAGGAGWLPLSIAFLVGAILVILFRCITLEEAYEFIDWRLIILIAGMTAFGVAMEKTGAAEFLANWVVSWLAPYGITAIMAGFFILTVILTQPMSNAAAALVVLPVALHVAQDLEVNQRTFAIAIMLAASVSFIAPFEPSAILVYGPGRYQFMDFVKTGLWLTVILLIIILVLLPMFWPL
jgi:di/tricarboxylate transporter